MAPLSEAFASKMNATKTAVSGRLMRFRAFRREDDAALNNLGTILLLVTAAILTPVVVVLLMAALVETYFGSLANFTAALTAADTGSPIGNAILDVMVIVISITGVLAFIGVPLAFLVIKVRARAASI